MSVNLDKSLDDIVVGRRQDARRRGSRRNKASTATGGVKKNKATKAATGKGAKSAPAPAPKDSKIMVSGMPADVNEANIKEYFTKSAGPVKKVMLTYNQNGTSQGIASIIFSKPETAAKAARELNGLLVDGRPMKIEVIVDAARAPGIPEPKPLTERVAGQPKAQPKPATEAKAGRRNRRAARRGKAANRPKPKTSEELDAEMDDYFVTENGAPAEGNAPVNGQAQQQPATNGGGEDLGMGDISASPSQPTASIENSFGSSFTFASTSSSMFLSPTSAPSLPPSTTTNTTTTTTTSLDSKPSPFNTTASQSSSSSSCAFPSWPNRPSLVSTNTCTSTTSASSAYISDEELLDTPLSSPAVESECPFDNSAVSMGMGMGMGTSMSFASEQRIRHMREIAEEEEHRAKFLAQVQAHARVQMAKRGLQPPPQPQPQQQQQQQQQQQAPIAARRKRRAIVPVGKKRRAASGTSSRGYPRV